MNLPAICNKCGCIFESGFDLGFGSTMTISNCTSGPCPRCGNFGNVPNGVYKFINDTVQLIASSGASIEEINVLNRILKDARNNKISIDNAIDDIEKHAPRLSNISDLFPKTREEKRDDIKFFITTILAILAIIIPLMINNNQEKEVNIEEVIYNVYQMENIEQIKESKQVNLKKIGRNEPCPCGSGKKYKKCCLK